MLAHLAKKNETRCKDTHTHTHTHTRTHTHTHTHAYDVCIPSEMVEFERKFAGEWVGYESSFKRDGQVVLVPDYLLPPDLIEWEVVREIVFCE